MVYGVKDSREVTERETRKFLRTSSSDEVVVGVYERRFGGMVPMVSRLVRIQKF